jgi:ATP-dependent RNA helicase DHR2
MPPRLHTKFNDDSPEPTVSKTGKSDNVPEKSPKRALAKGEENPLEQTNGVKRARHGSPEPNSTSKPAQPSQPQKAGHSQTKGNTTPGLAKAAGVPQKKQNVQILKPNGVKQSSLPRANQHLLQKTAKELEKVRKLLPIWSKKPDIRWALRNNDVLLLNGETGSGKSTQTPQFLYTEPWCKKTSVKVKSKDGRDEEVSIGGIIAVTEPRRVAAITLAKRVAREMGSFMGKGSESGLVGYSVRFDSILPKGMKIKFLTEGMLLQEILRDPHLRQYSAVIVDEIHERSIDVDLIAGFLRQIVHGDKKGRGGIPLKVVIMSATLDLGGLEAFFAKPETQPNYKPGQNHGRILAPHLLEEESGGANGDSTPGQNPESPESQSGQSSRASFSSWGGISSSDDDKNQPTNGKAITNGIPAEDAIQSDAESDILDEFIAENGVAVEYVEGRQYEVKVFYDVVPSSDYLQNMLQTILKLHTTEPLPGDILAFLTGQEEIETLQMQLEHYAGQLVKTLPKMKIMPLYGALSAQAQQDAFEKVKEHFTRKIVLATNIAETSVTVSGVHFVVDCGKLKVKQYRPRLGMESLLAKPTSKVSAIQRAGRAGRETAGKCFRLYTEEDFLKLESDEKPEILRSDVIEAVLKMKACGVKDVLDFSLMDSPDIRAIEISLLQLHIMGALDGEGNLTDTGKKMARYPLPAAYGRVIIAAAESGCLLDAIDIISCLTSDTEVFLQPKSEEDQEATETARTAIRNPRGDVLTYLETLHHYAAENTDRNDWCQKRLVSIRAMKMAMSIRRQLRQICFQQKLLDELPPPDPQPVEEISSDRAEVLLKTFLKAFATRTAVLSASGYLTTQGHHEIVIHPSSVLYGKKVEAIMFLDNVYTAKNYAKKVSAIQANWIVDALEI